MSDISPWLYISTTAGDAAGMAREYGFGLEIAEFCTAFNMDIDFEKWDALVREKMRGISRFTFHAPYNELCPAAVDPLVVEIAKKRYAQAYLLMRGYGINAMVVHSGFMPLIYNENWFVEKSVAFWKEFMSDKPDNFHLHLENTFEPSPGMLCEIADAVNDGRFTLCLDIGHASYAGKPTPIDTWVERALPYLGHVHLNNNYGQADTHNDLGDGIIGVNAIIRKIMGAASNVTFTIETINSKPSVEWLKAGGLLQV